VAAPIVDADVEALCEAGHDERPLVVIDPGAVDEHKRVAEPNSARKMLTPLTLAVGIGASFSEGRL
jgi:hypothetical protein